MKLLTSPPFPSGCSRIWPCLIQGHPGRQCSQAEFPPPWNTMELDSPVKEFGQASGHQNGMWGPGYHVDIVRQKSNKVDSKKLCWRMQRQPLQNHCSRHINVRWKRRKEDLGCYLFYVLKNCPLSVTCWILTAPNLHVKCRNFAHIEYLN